MDKQFSPSQSIGGFSAIWQKRSAEELRELAHIKRFMECLKGDPVFREKLAERIDDNPISVAQEYGIAVDPDLFRPLFHAHYAQFRFAEAQEQWALAQRWDEYSAEIATFLNSMMSSGDAKVNPRFYKWRKRQIARVGFELGDGAYGIVHPIAAYELSQGCSVGCWFCGVSADKFKGYMSFADHENLWRDILNVMVQRFGDAAQTGFCYWATDPSDNPDYVSFIKVHAEITGFVPQTTTAAPLKNLVQTREILQLFNDTRGIWNRFSILSVGQLRRVHATFTPEELLGVELVLQNSDALSSKYAAGRATNQVIKSKASPDSELKNGTVACVSGFLIKPLEGMVELISPTAATEKWSDGYRIYGRASFHNAAEFGSAIDQLIEKFMPERLVASDRLAFRDDLSFELEINGFKLFNSKGHMNIQGDAWVQLAGQLINAGNKTQAEIIAVLAPHHTSAMDATHFLEDMFQAGFLNDDPVHGGIGISEITHLHAT